MAVDRTAHPWAPDAEDDDETIQRKQNQLLRFLGDPEAFIEDAIRSEDLLTKGHEYGKVHDSLRSLAYYLQSFRLSHEEGNMKVYSDTSDALGKLLYNLDCPRRALEYLKIRYELLSGTPTTEEHSNNRIKAPGERATPYWLEVDAANLWELRAATLRRLGWSNLRIGKVTTARQYFQKRLQVVLEEDDSAICIQSHMDIASLSLQEREIDDAISHYMSALKLAQATGDNQVHTQILYFLGQCYQEEFDYETSLTFFEEQLKLAEQQSDIYTQTNACAAIGHMLILLERHEEALEILLRGVHLSDNEYIFQQHKSQRSTVFTSVHDCFELLESSYIQQDNVIPALAFADASHARPVTHFLCKLFDMEKARLRWLGFPGNTPRRLEAIRRVAQNIGGYIVVYSIVKYTASVHIWVVPPDQNQDIAFEMVPLTAALGTKVWDIPALMADFRASCFVQPHAAASDEWIFSNLEDVVQNNVPPNIPTEPVNDEQLWKKFMSTFYELLVQPIAQHLPFSTTTEGQPDTENHPKDNDNGSNNNSNVPLVCFTPCDELWYVPWTALYNKERDRYLIEDFMISVSPSIGLLEVLTQQHIQQLHQLDMYNRQTVYTSEIDKITYDIPYMELMHTMGEDAGTPYTWIWKCLQVAYKLPTSSISNITRYYMGRPDLESPVRPPIVPPSGKPLVLASGGLKEPSGLMEDEGRAVSTLLQVQPLLSANATKQAITTLLGPCSVVAHLAVNIVVEENQSTVDGTKMWNVSIQLAPTSHKVDDKPYDEYLNTPDLEALQLVTNASMIVCSHVNVVPSRIRDNEVSSNAHHSRPTTPNNSSALPSSTSAAGGPTQRQQQLNSYPQEGVCAVLSHLFGMGSPTVLLTLWSFKKSSATKFMSTFYEYWLLYSSQVTKLQRGASKVPPQPHKAKALRLAILETMKKYPVGNWAQWMLCGCPW